VFTSVELLESEAEILGRFANRLAERRGAIDEATVETALALTT
jgi:hypothetical protein